MSIKEGYINTQELTLENPNVKQLSESLIKLFELTKSIDPDNFFIENFASSIIPTYNLALNKDAIVILMVPYERLAFMQYHLPWDLLSHTVKGKQDSKYILNEKYKPLREYLKERLCKFPVYDSDLLNNDIRGDLFGRVALRNNGLPATEYFRELRKQFPHVVSRPFSINSDIDFAFSQANIMNEAWLKGTKIADISAIFAIASIVNTAYEYINEQGEDIETSSVYLALDIYDSYFEMFQDELVKGTQSELVKEKFITNRQNFIQSKQVFHKIINETYNGHLHILYESYRIAELNRIQQYEMEHLVRSIERAQRQPSRKKSFFDLFKK